MSTQWGYLNPETYVAPKPKQVKGLGMLEAKSSDDENEDDENDTQHDTSMTTKMNTFIDQIENYETKKLEKIESKRKRREEKEKAKIEPRRWGPWIEYFDSETNHVYYYNESTKETVWKLSSETKAKYEAAEPADEGTNGDSTEPPDTPKRLDQGRKSITDQLESKSGKRRRSRSKSRSESRSRSRSPSRRSKRSPTPRSRKRSPSPRKSRHDRHTLKDADKKCNQLLEKLEYFKFNNRKNFHKLQIAHIQIETRKEDFEAGKLDIDYFHRKLKESQKEIQAFEETAAPPGHSLLWDDTDKTYGYVNNYTGEVTFKYPTTVTKPKKIEKVEPAKTVTEPTSASKPWKYSLDGSISGTLGGERKKPVGSTAGKPAILSQTDILKDKLTLERVKTPPRKSSSSSATTPTQTARPINNEMKDRRLARLGIQIEPIREAEKEETENSDKIEKTEETLPAEPQFHAKEGNMDISDDDEDGDRREMKRKKRKKEKSSKKGQKTKLDMLEKWKQRQQDEQTSLWNQLGI